jgi:hypothetical protein
LQIVQTVWTDADIDSKPSGLVMWLPRRDSLGPVEAVISVCGGVGLPAEPLGKRFIVG